MGSEARVRCLTSGMHRMEGDCADLLRMSLVMEL